MSSTQAKPSETSTCPPDSTAVDRGFTATDDLGAGEKDLATHTRVDVSTQPLHAPTRKRPRKPSDDIHPAKPSGGTLLTSRTFASTVADAPEDASRAPFSGEPSTPLGAVQMGHEDSAGFDTGGARAVPRIETTELCRSVVLEYDDIVRELPLVRCDETSSSALPRTYITDSDCFWVADRSPYLIRASKLEPKKAHILTRPRRFGKTTFMNMLREYWDCAISDDHYVASMAGFWIVKNREQWKGRGEYMVWSVTLGPAATDPATTVREENSSFAWRYDVPYNSTGDAFADMRTMLAFAHRTRPARKIAVLVDEFDSLINAGIEISPECINFEKGVSQSETFFAQLKLLLDQVVVDRVFVTGLTPLALPLFGSSFNCFIDHTHRRDFTYACGFFGNDVESGLRVALAARVDPSKLGSRIQEEREKMRAAYSGYRFSQRRAASEPATVAVYNSTCVCHYLGVLARRGVVIDQELLPPTVALSDHAVAAIHEIPEHMSLLTDLLSENGVLQLDNRYLSWPKVLRSSRSSRDFAIALLFYHGAATFTEDVGNALVCPNQTIAKVLVNDISSVVASRSDLTAAAQALVAHGDAASFVGKVFETKTLIYMTSTCGELSEYALQSRLVSAFIAAVPDNYRALKAEVRLNVHAALPHTRADLMIPEKVLVMLKVASRAAVNAFEALQRSGSECTFSALLRNSKSFCIEVREAAAQAAHCMCTEGVRKFVCIAINHDVALTVELSKSLKAEELDDAAQSIKVDDTMGGLVLSLAHKGDPEGL